MDERVEINASTQSLAHGLDVNFTSTNGHGLGDCWNFTARPQNSIVQIISGGNDQANRTLTRDALKNAIDHQRDLGLLSIRTSTEATSDKLYLYHLMDRLIDHDISVSGTSIPNLGLTEDDDNVSRREHAFGETQNPFGVTWQPGAPGNYYIYAIAFDKRVITPSFPDLSLLHPPRVQEFLRLSRWNQLPEILLMLVHLKQSGWERLPPMQMAISSESLFM